MFINVYLRSLEFMDGQVRLFPTFDQSFKWLHDYKAGIGMLKSISKGRKLIM